MYCHFLLLVLLAAPNALGFSLSLHTPSSSCCNTVLHAAAQRRAFVQGMAAAAFFSAITPAFADDVDDLAMPSEDEEAKAKAVRGGISFFFYHVPTPVSRLYRNVLRMFPFCMDVAFSFLGVWGENQWGGVA